APVLAAREDAAQEISTVRVEVREDVLPLAAGRTHAVARVERRALLEQTVELEVGENRLQHERTHIVARRQLVFRDRKLLAFGMGEHILEQACDRLGGRRVAKREVLER